MGLAHISLTQGSFLSATGFSCPANCCAITGGWACRICTGENKSSKKESWPCKQPPYQPLTGKSGVQEPLPWQLLFMWQAVCFRQKLNILGDNGFGLMAVTVLRGQPKHQPQGNGRLKGLERARELVPRSVLVSLAWGRVQCANCAPESCGSAVSGSACEVRGICTQSLRDWVCYFSCLATCTFSYSQSWAGGILV